MEDSICSRMATLLQTYIQGYKQALVAYKNNEFKKGVTFLEQQNETGVLLKKLSWISDERDYCNTMISYMKKNIADKDQREKDAYQQLFDSYDSSVAYYESLSDGEVMRDELGDSLMRLRSQGTNLSLKDYFVKAVLTDLTGGTVRSFAEIRDFNELFAIMKQTNFLLRGISVPFQIPKKEIEPFFQRLQKIPLLDLRLDKIKLGSEEARLIARYLPYTTITYISLSVNNFADSDLRILLSAFENCRLNYLNLVGNPFTEKGKQMIHAFAQKHPEMHIEYDMPEDLEMK